MNVQHQIDIENALDQADNVRCHLEHIDVLLLRNSNILIFEELKSAERYLHQLRVLLLKVEADVIDDQEKGD